MTFKAEAENQLGQTIKVLKFDRGGECTFNALSLFCEQNGIVHEFSAPYTPAFNGVAERKNITLMDIINTMLLSSRVLENL